MTIRRIIYALIAIATALMLMGGCFTQDNRGYPEYVSFGKQGGTKVLSGNVSLTEIQIEDRSGNGEYSDCWVAVEDDNGHIDYLQSDSIAVTYQWLTVKASCTSNQITMIADSLKPGQRTRLYVVSYNCYEYIKITVTHK